MAKNAKAKITMQFLGTGAAFTVGVDNYQSNMLLTHENGSTLLIDCGTDARHALHELGKSYRDIDEVYISHLHADHMGGLEWLGFTRRFDESCDRPILHLSEQIAKDIWEKSLSGTMSSVEGEITTLDSYFDVRPVPENGSFKWQGIEFTLVQTIHIMNGYALSPCHGLFFKINGTAIYITADTQFTPHLLTRMYEDADIIFHDCETSPIHSNVHAHYTELVDLDDATKQKMWLYHYNPGPRPDAEAAGFRGFVKKGQRFEF